MTSLDIEEFVKFMRDFIASEYHALVVQYTERDDHKFQLSRAVVEQFLGNGVRSDLNRPYPAEDWWFDRGKELVDGELLQPRRLFQIKLYHHPVHDVICRAYTSLPFRSTAQRLIYAANFYISRVGLELKIISRYDLDILPQEGKRLSDRSLSWILHSGVHIDELGELVEVRKFEAPDMPDQRAEFEAE